MAGPRSSDLSRRRSTNGAPCPYPATAAGLADLFGLPFARPIDLREVDGGRLSPPPIPYSTRFSCLPLITMTATPSRPRSPIRDATQVVDDRARLYGRRVAPVLGPPLRYLERSTRLRQRARHRRGGDGRLESGELDSCRARSRGSARFLLDSDDEAPISGWSTLCSSRPSRTARRNSTSSPSSARCRCRLPHRTAFLSTS